MVGEAGGGRTGRYGGAVVDMGRRGHEQGWPREELCATVCSRWHFKSLLSHWLVPLGQLVAPTARYVMQLVH